MLNPEGRHSTHLTIYICSTRSRPSHFFRSNSHLPGILLFVVERCCAFAETVDDMTENSPCPRPSTALYPLLTKEP